MFKKYILFNLSFLCLFLGCNLNVADFTFTAEQKIEISTAIFDKLFSPKNIIKAEKGQGYSPYFMLKDAYQTYENQAFFVTFSNNGLSQITLSLNKSGKTFEHSYTITLPKNTSSFQIRQDLPANIQLKGFQINTDNQEGELVILDSGITDSLLGFFYEGQKLIYNPDMIMNGNEFDFTPIQKNHVTSNHYFQLNYNFTPLTDKAEPPTLVNTFIQSDLKQIIISLLPKNGKQSVYFHQGLIQFNPSYFYFDKLSENFNITGFRIVPEASTNSNMTVTPLPADLGTIHQYNQKSWRQHDYELYSWNLFPKVLIFDTADYDIQSRFFKRLAFFTEKKGYIGQVLSNEDLTNKHGWNAHDYKAEDLANFFTKATRQNTELLPEEWLLRDILLSQSVIVQNNNQYSPNEGSIISVSRASGKNLHRTLLAHEAFHGVFFINSEFRIAIQELWKSKPKAQKEMWKYFFSTLSYNPEDNYLMANEYMAYLLQTDRRTSYAYLNDYKFPQAAARYPEWENIILGPIKNNPQLILNLHSEIEEITYKTTGLRGGLNYCLEIQ